MSILSDQSNDLFRDILISYDREGAGKLVRSHQWVDVTPPEIEDPGCPDDTDDTGEYYPSIPPPRLIMKVKCAKCGAVIELGEKAHYVRYKELIFYANGKAIKPPIKCDEVIVQDVIE